MRAVNLIPADERAGASVGAGRSGGGVYAVLGLLGGLAVMALLYGRADHQISSRRAEVASLTARAQQAQARATALAPYTSFVQMREQREQAVSALVDSRFDWAQTFRELGRVLPAGKVSLTSVSGAVGSSTGSGATSGAAAGSSATASSGTGASASAASTSLVKSATPPGSVPTFTLTGCATSQAEVALMLERLRLIVGVKEVALQSSAQSSSSSGGGGSGSGSGGGCASGNPAFTAQVVFDALPTVSASSSSGSTATVAASAGGSASTPSTGAVR
jgi:Tfp pilus assembly protein PilN